jgi:serine/threonine protein kinase
MPRAVCEGRYVLGEVLGSGNFGKVYNALDKRTGQFVAVKEVQKAAVNCVCVCVCVCVCPGLTDGRTDRVSELRGGCHQQHHAGG